MYVNKVRKAHRLCKTLEYSQQNSEAAQLRPEGWVPAHPLLGSRARLAHTQALALLQLLRVLLEWVAKGPEGLALRVELDFDLL